MRERFCLEVGGHQIVLSLWGIGDDEGINCTVLIMAAAARLIASST